MENSALAIVAKYHFSKIGGAHLKVHAADLAKIWLFSEIACTENKAALLATVSPNGALILI